MNIRDFFDVALLEEVMEEWSKATGMATIAMDDKNEYLTGEIGFTDFCTKYTRGTKEGLRRCIMSDADNMGVYYCHSGLMDFSINICLDDGTYLGKVIGGQILANKPDVAHFRELAEEFGINPDEYIDALSKIEIRSEEAIQASAYLLGRVVNLLVNSEYTKKKQENVIIQLDEEIKLDVMTGIYNKMYLKTSVENKISNKEPFALIIVDVDEFKYVNDNYGHIEGDIVLKSLASELKSTFRSTDIVGRFGGDEFYVVIDGDLKQEELEQYGDRICEMARSMDIEGLDYNITTSVGIAAYPEHGNDYMTLFYNADKALYQAKKGGKDHYALYQLI